MNTPKPYGFAVEFEHALPNGGITPQYATATLRRKGSEQAAKRAAGLTKGFRRILSIVPIPAAEAPPARIKRSSQVKPETVPAIPDLPERQILTPDGADNVCDAVRAIKKLSNDLAEIASRRRDMIDAIKRNLNSILSLLPADSDRTRLVAMNARCDDLLVLINAEEFETWTITVNRVMEETWRIANTPPPPPP